jgi:hypothetical protein
MRNLIVLISGSLLLLMTQLASAEQPNFMAAIYGDGKAWGTKGTTSLPAPNAANTQSFDKLYVFENFNDPNAVQLAVSEAAPGNPNYNGGRWSAQSAIWTEAGFLAYGYVPVLKSEEEIQYNVDMGYLEIIPRHTYFQCPLLPVK